MTQRKGSIMNLLKKTIIILLSSPMITLFACQLGTELWIAFPKKKNWATSLNPGFLSPPMSEGTHLQERCHRLSFHSNSQNSMLSDGHYSFKLILSHFPTCAVYSIHIEPLTYLQAPSSWTPHFFANAVPLSTWNVPSLLHRTVKQTHKCFLSSSSISYPAPSRRQSWSPHWSWWRWWFNPQSISPLSAAELTTTELTMLQVYSHDCTTVSLTTSILWAPWKW